LVPVFISGWIGQGEQILHAIQKYDIRYLQLFLPTVLEFEKLEAKYDIRTIDGPFSPADRFFTTQHYGHPVVEPAAFRLKVTGEISRPLSLSLDDLRKIGSAEQSQKLRSEIAIVDEYLPKRASAEETAALVDQFLAAQSFTPQQVGQAMGAFMKAHGSQVEPAVANKLIRERLK
jgi:hypothetical protein